MKFKTTKKAIKDGYTNIISMPYCSAQSLLRFVEPIAYTSGTYGWDCDYYDIDGVCVCTGYRTVGAPIDHYKLSSYEHTACIISDSNMSYDDQSTEVNTLLSTMIQEVTNV